MIACTPERGRRVTAHAPTHHNWGVSDWLETLSARACQYMLYIWVWMCTCECVRVAVGTANRCKAAALTVIANTPHPRRTANSLTPSHHTQS